MSECEGLRAWSLLQAKKKSQKPLIIVVCSGSMTISTYRSSKVKGLLI